MKSPVGSLWTLRKTNIHAVHVSAERPSTASEPRTFQICLASIISACWEFAPLKEIIQFGEELSDFAQLDVCTRTKEL